MSAAVDYGGQEISLVAGVAVTKNLVVTMETDGYVDVADSAGEKALGVAQNTAAAGEMVRVRIGGTTRVKAGESFEEGVELQVDSDGMVITASTGDYIIGQAITPSGADGDIITMLICHSWPIS